MPNNLDLYEFTSKLYEYPDIGWYILISNDINSDIYKVVTIDNDKGKFYGEYIDRKKLRIELLDSDKDGIFDWYDAYYYDLDYFGHAGEYWRDTFGCPLEGTIIWNNSPMIVTFSGKYTIDMESYHKPINNNEIICMPNRLLNK